jgi:hypothetical protein
MIRYEDYTSKLISDMYICEKHIELKKESPLCPPRYKCNKCKKKGKICGYSNPDHITNPFGYLYLIPNICVECSLDFKKCMWCE